MQLFSNVALPIDKIIIGESVSVREILKNAKIRPLHFAFESFAFSMMIVGTIVTSGWAYECGKLVGTAIG